MKKNFKLFFILISLILLPITVKAATFELESTAGGAGQDNVTYTIYFDPQLKEDEEPIPSVMFKINNNNDNLNYTLKEIDSDTFKGTCGKNDCTLVTATINKRIAVATLKVDNPTETTQDVQLSLIYEGQIFEKQVSLSKSTTKPVEVVKNTDPNLKSLSTSQGTMDKNFNKDELNYVVTGVKDTVNYLTVNATCDNNCTIDVICPNGECTVKDNKTVYLQVGANQVLVLSKSEDGNNTKSYILNIYRGEVETNSAYLSTLTIKDAILSPKFESLVNDYSVTVKNDVETLDITTIAEDPKAIIEIKGNENLQVGENTVTITVTSSDKKNIQVYTIVVTKEESEETTTEEDTIKTEKVEKKEDKKSNLLLIICIVAGVLVILAVVFIIIFKKKKNKNNKNKPNGGNKIEDTVDIDQLLSEDHETNAFRNASNELMKNEPKQDIDEALDDLMQTKKLELGDLDL